MSLPTDEMGGERYRYRVKRIHAALSRSLPAASTADMNVTGRNWRQEFFNGRAASG